MHSHYSILEVTLGAIRAAGKWGGNGEKRGVEKWAVGVLDGHFFFPGYQMSCTEIGLH